MTGLVVSVGGLTESLVKASSACLLSHLASYTPVELEQFALALLGVFKRHALDDRVTVPLLTMVDLLFCTCVLEPLLGVEPVTSQLLALTRAEMKKTQNVKKLRAGVEVLCGLMLAAGEVRRKALSSLMLYICHRSVFCSPFILSCDPMTLLVPLFVKVVCSQAHRLPFPSRGRCLVCRSM